VADKINKLKRDFIFNILGTTDYFLPFLDQGQVISGYENLSMADCLVFTGGEDVSPALYGEERIPKVPSTNDDRDKRELAAYRYALTNGIPMVGICRGAQFLNVMNGGKLIQHVNGHGVDHRIRIPASSRFEMHEFNVTSTHHQMMVPALKRHHQMLGYSEDVATYMEGIPFVEYAAMSEQYSSGKMKAKEIEVLWYETSGSLCVQYHPERMNKAESGYKYFQHLLERFIVQ